MHTIKIIAGLSALFLLLLGVSIYTSKIITNSSENLEQMVTRVEENARAGDWKKAEEELAKVSKDWEKTERTWAMLLDHIEIDNISTTLRRMERYIETENPSSALAEAAVLKQYLKHIPDKESFRLKNLF